MFNKHPLELLDAHVVARQQDANSDFSATRINAALYDKVMFLISKPAGSAGDDLSLKFLQADAASGGNSKAINFDRIFYKLDGAAQWTELELAAETNDLDTGATGVTGSEDLAGDTVAAEFAVIFRNDQLDGQNGYKFIEYVNEGDDVSNALLVNVTAIPVMPRYSGKIPLSPVA